MHLLHNGDKDAPLSWLAFHFKSVLKARSRRSISSTKDFCYFASL